MKIKRKQLRQLINELMIGFGPIGGDTGYEYEFVAMHDEGHSYRYVVHAPSHHLTSHLNGKEIIIRKEHPDQEIADQLAVLWKRKVRNFADARDIEYDEQGVPRVPVDAITPLAEVIKSHDTNYHEEIYRDNTGDGGLSPLDSIGPYYDASLPSTNSDDDWDDDDWLI